MNPRIKELLDQATEVYDDRYRGEGVVLVDHKMFAELIVGDCIAQIALVGITNCEDEAVTWCVNTCINNIKSRFGLEKQQ